jgi:hypothetical protein
MGEKISAFINTANFFIDKTVKLNLKTTERNGHKRQGIYFSKLLDGVPPQPQPKSQTANFQDDIPF